MLCEFVQTYLVEQLNKADNKVSCELLMMKIDQILKFY